jgi:hypothetical protein
MAVNNQKEETEPCMTGPFVPTQKRLATQVKPKPLSVFLLFSFLAGLGGRKSEFINVATAGAGI